LKPELNVPAAVLLRALPRRPTFSELVPFWRELVICDGEHVEDWWKKDGFERLYDLLLHPTCTALKR
jgi:hypothetical protein